MFLANGESTARRTAAAAALAARAYVDEEGLLTDPRPTQWFAPLLILHARLRNGDGVLRGVASIWRGNSGWASDERPRDFSRRARTLSDAELRAILLRTG